jgi:hypothetical protein
MKIEIIFLFAFSTLCIFAQSSSLDFYPLHVNNQWQYSNGECVTVENDTLLSNGLVYKKIVTSNCLSNQILFDYYERIDSLTSQVYRYSYFCNGDVLIDSLAARENDHFRAIRFGVEPPCEGLSVCSYFITDTVFGLYTQMKSFHGIYATDPPEYIMARGFGIVRMYGYYFGKELRFAIINNVQYGTPITSIRDNNYGLNEFRLSQNYPNPFNSSSVIKYSLPTSSKVIIKVFDILGTEIETLVNEEKPSGTYEVTWNATNLPSGIYFYRIQSGNFIDTKKMILLK